MPFEIDRGLYARVYGPTTGDRVRLGDTIAQGLAHEVGSLEPGKLADVALWRPRYFLA